MLHVLSSKTWLNQFQFPLVLNPKRLNHWHKISWHVDHLNFFASEMPSDICYSSIVSRNLVCFSRSKPWQWNKSILYPWSFWQTFWPVWPIKSIHMKLRPCCRYQTVISLITNMAFGDSVQPHEGMGEIHSYSSGTEASVWSIAAEESARHRLTTAHVEKSGWLLWKRPTCLSPKSMRCV